MSPSVTLADYHPGGATLMRRHAAPHDATSAFRQVMHTRVALAKLERMCIGRLRET